MKSRFLVGILIVGLCFSSGVPALASSYDLAVSGSIDTPTQTVSFEGTTYQVDSIARSQPNATLPVSITAPDDVEYDVYLYDSDRRISDRHSGTGDDEVSFDLTRYEPGSYMLVLSEDGEYKTILPVVIRGYHVETTTESQAKSLEVSVSLTNEADTESPSKVTVVAFKNDAVFRSEATEQPDGSYHASISSADAQNGKYQVYAVVQGSDTAFKKDRKELLGISDPVEIDAKNHETTTADPSDPPSDSTTTVHSTTTTTPLTTFQTTTLNETSTTTQPRQTTLDATPTTQSTQSTDTPTKTSTTRSVITPASTTQHSTTPDTPTGVPVDGFSIGTAFVALCSGLYLYQRRAT